MITSKENQRIKNIIKLQKSSERLSQGLFVVEGYREIERALISGYEINALFACEEITKSTELKSIIQKTSKPNETEHVSKEVFEKLAYREGSDGLIAVFKPRILQLSDLKLSDNPLIIILESIEKPGNLGAVLRTADAAGVDAVILCDTLPDLYNPNIIRSSLGCIFSQQIVSTTTEAAINWLKKKNISIFCTYLDASVDYRTIDYVGSSAIVMGAESTGLSDSWIKNSTQNIIIPMKGIADSLNVSVSSAIVVFEALRQRQK